MHISAPPLSAYTKDNPLPAKLLENRVLNKDGSSKDTRHLVVDIAGSGLTYQVGDSLGIFASNRPQIVEELIELLGFTGNEPVIPQRMTAAISLREALTTKLSLAGPTKKILETFAAKTADPKEQAFAAEQIAAEAKVAELCEAAHAAWTVFRPTLIYGAGMDRNVVVIARLIRRFGVFPLFGAASGRRQPVHADDLAAACVAALVEPRAFNAAYELAGGETLSYREMVERIFVAEGKTPRFLPVPLAAFRAAMWCVSRIPRFKDFNAEMARRMNEDLVFDTSRAVRDFGFAPRKFEPAP